MPEDDLRRSSFPNVSGLAVVIEAILLTILYFVCALAVQSAAPIDHFIYSVPGSLVLAAITLFLMAVGGFFETAALIGEQKHVVAGVAIFSGLLGISLLAPTPLSQVSSLTDLYRIPLFSVAVSIWPALLFGAYVLAFGPTIRSLARSASSRARLFVVGTGAAIERWHGENSSQAMPLRNVVGELAIDHHLKVVGGDDVAASDLDIDVYSAARQTKASTVIIDIDDKHEFPLRGILRCKAGGLQVMSASEFNEHRNGVVSIENVQRHDRIASSGFYSRIGLPFLLRFFDIVLSIFLLLLLLPLLLLVALIVKLQDGGKIFYRQERVGLDGATFQILKFRTMREDAEFQSEPRWAEDNDPRVTPVGRYLRMFRIDELPQIYNVLKGDMSLVGPRPERPFFVEQLRRNVPYYSLRHTVKPGITGWAQVNFRYGSSVEDAKIKHAYDLYYVKYRSIRLYLLSLVRTLHVVLWPGSFAR